MIGIIGQRGFLPQETADQQMEGSGERYKYYRSYDAMLADKDEIEIIINAKAPNKEVISQLPNLKWMFSYFAGVDSYPLELLKERGIVLTNTSGLHKTNIAEQVLGSMILFSRNLLQAMTNKLQKVWAPYPIDELIGKKLLIIGTGNIGREIARKAKAFDMKVVGVRFRDDQAKPENFDEVYNIRDLMTVLPGKDYVCLVVPATKATIGMMGETQFKAMDPTAVFINVGRGDSVKEAELIQALTGQVIKGAILDVFNVEPLPSDSPLWEMPNVVLTPHIAGPTPYYDQRAFEMFFTNLEAFRTHKPLSNLIDFQRGY